jgi:hypothetical protein
MLTIREHGVTDYVALRDMDATDVGVLTDDDRACLDALGQYLVATDSWRRFAIWLLHKHFEPKHGEVFVERVLADTRQTRTMPMQRSVLSARELSATAVCFDSAAESGVSVIGMEFAESDDFGAIAPLSFDDEEVLAGIAELLEHYGKTQRFGVRLARNPLEVSEREVLLESCDMAHRMLQCDITGREALGVDHEVIETTWQWKPVRDESGITVVQACTTTCLRGEENHNILHST